MSGAPASPGFGPPLSPYPGMVPPVDPGQRPTTVTAAVALTFAGAALAFISTVLFFLFSDGWMAAEALDTADDVSVSGATTFIAAGINLVGAAGASACAIFATRGLNGARIMLCVLSCVFAVWKLSCGGFWGLAAVGAGMDEDPAIAGAAAYLYGAVAIDFVLMLLAIAIFVLLLVGQSNRFFNPPRMMATRRY